MEMETNMTEDEEFSSKLLSELITSLELATRMAKKLPNTTDPSRITRITSTLHSAHHSLSLFLAHRSLRHLPQPIMDDDVALDDDDDDVAVDDVEAGLRACFIKKKRPKRRLSPALETEEEEKVEKEFDPVGDKLRGLELVHQFHG